MKKEVEVFGVTYDRYVLLQLHKALTCDLNLKRIVEMPSHGAKAAGSLYSIGFGLAGCTGSQFYRWLMWARAADHGQKTGYAPTVADLKALALNLHSGPPQQPPLNLNIDGRRHNG